MIRSGILNGCLVAIALAMAGCGKGDGKPRIYIADEAHRHFKPVIEKAFVDAAKLLGMAYNQPDINVSTWTFAEGIAKTKWGWKGVMHRHDGKLGVMGAYTDEKGNVTLYLTDGAIWYSDPAAAPVVHEVGHLILDSHAVPRSKHHEIMKERGFKW